jgi:hypothetical protein
MQTIKKYKLAVGAIFKNEEHCIIEWIEHYLYHGVEHFYLIDDSSNDTSVDKCKPYIEKGLITLFNQEHQWSNYYGRQRDMYNHYILPHIQETQWLAMVDLDEFLWSPLSINLSELLMNQCMHYGQIQISCNHFGSSGYKTQPENIVGHFFMRTAEEPSQGIVGLRKYVINTNFEFSSLNVHHADFANKELYENEKYFIVINNNFLILNHYRIQSLEFWEKVKCTRGDVNNYTQQTLDLFRQYDINEVEDKRLYEQNLALFHL